MKYLRNFTENLEDEFSIEDWCYKFSITDYEIVDDLVDVDDEVNLDIMNIQNFPFQFGVVSGKFSCYSNQLRTLKGCPKEVGGYFNCGHNRLDSLEGAPIKVGGYFSCHNNNNLRSLKYCPIEVGDDFICHHINLMSLEGSPMNINGDFVCYDNNLTSLIGGPKEVRRHLRCRDNILFTLEGCPEKMPRKIDCENNPIFHIYKLFPTHESYLESLDQNYFRLGGKIVKRRFEKALREIGIMSAPKFIKSYEYIE
jgi:hypothetical protein